MLISSSPLLRDDQGATWDAPLVRSVASAIARQARANGVDRGFSPEINVCTDPRFGRTEENFGEDPTLVAAMGAAAVSGLHAGNAEGPSSYLNRTTAIVSEAKHAAAYVMLCSLVVSSRFRSSSPRMPDVRVHSLYKTTCLHIHRCALFFVCAWIDRPITRSFVLLSNPLGMDLVARTALLQTFLLARCTMSTFVRGASTSCSASVCAV